MSALTTPANHYRGIWAPNAFNCPRGAAHSLSRTTDEGHKQSPLAPICIILGRLPSITLFRQTMVHNRCSLWDQKGCSFGRLAMFTALGLGALIVLVVGCTCLAYFASDARGW